MDHGDEANQADLVSSVSALNQRCQTILNDCAARQEAYFIDGMYRLTQPLTSESLFLEKLLNNPSTIKQKYIQSSNLSYLEAVHAAMTVAGPINDIMRATAVPPPNGQWMPLATMLRKQSLKVDLVVEQERVWIKVIARNAKSFRHEMAGLEWDDSDDDYEYDDNFSDSDQGGLTTAQAISFDELPIFKKARTYLACAQAHPVHFKTPVVVFAFMRIQYDEDPFVQRIMDRLEEMGICLYFQDHQQQGMPIRTRYLPAMQQAFLNDSSLTTTNLNLDVSTVMAMVSQLSHHGCQADEIEGEALQTQAHQESTQPILPILQHILVGKKLFMVQSAFDRLKSIMDVVAGPTEIRRYHYLFPNDHATRQDDDEDLWTTLTPPSLITIVPDQPSMRFQQLLELPVTPFSKLNNGKKIRSKFSPFHAGIFGTADTLQMSTVTAIQWMPAALVEAGLLGSAIVTHPPRSLAEQKMHTKKVE